MIDDPNRAVTTLPPLPSDRVRGSTVIALFCWFLLLTFVAGWMSIRDEEDGTTGSHASDALFLMEARYAVGVTRTAGPIEPLVSQLRSFAHTVDQRIQYAVVTAELLDFAHACEELTFLETEAAIHADATADSDSPFALTEDQLRAIEILKRIYDRDSITAEDVTPGPVEFPSVSLSAEEVDLLVKSHGWFGELALVHAGVMDPESEEHVYAAADRTALVMFGGFMLGVVAGVAGFAGLVLMCVMLVLRIVRGGVAGGRAGHHVYLETFVIWFGLFGGLQYVVGKWVSQDLETSLVASGAAFAISLLALAWPCLRGVHWSDVRTDLGWTSGRGLMRESLIGAACYVMSLPMLAVGVLLTLFLLVQAGALEESAEPFAPGGAPVHPIILAISEGRPAVILLILGLGAVAAPIVEETMFRGALYRHLRDWSRPLGFIMSVALSTIVNASIFAIIHPQGIFAVPALMSLAVGFTLAREWRGTLIPSICMHSLNNAIMLGALSIALAG